MVNFIFDEFANIGTIPDIEQTIAVTRSRNIGISIILQSVAQLESRYDKKAKTIIDCCDTTLFLGGKSNSTNKEISEMIGKQTINQKTFGETRGQSGSSSKNIQIQGRDLIDAAEIGKMNVLGGWGISSSTMHPEFEDTADGYVLAEGMPGTAASLPYQVFREVVNEHDTNYLIALAIAIDALPKDSTCDMASETIRANADIDIAERRKSVLPDQAGLAAKKASCIESLTHIGGNAPVCGQNEIAR